VRLTAFPQSAHISLDGKPLDGNPHTSTMPEDGKAHRVRVTAEGYLPLEQEFRLEHDIDEVFRLQTAPTAESAAPPAASRRAASPNSEGDCDPPYIIDDRGIKRFKVECMR
jgi:hypothetical protein